MPALMVVDMHRVKRRARDENARVSEASAASSRGMRRAGFCRTGNLRVRGIYLAYGALGAKAGGRAAREL